MWSKERLHQLNEFDSVQKQRMELDLQLSCGLQQGLKDQFGARIITDKGYAVDCLTTGKTLRFHYDLDLIAVCNLSTPNQSFIHSFVGSLEEISGFSWEAFPQERSSWYKFYEQGKKRRIADTRLNDHNLPLGQKVDLHVVFSNDPFANNEQVTVLGKDNHDYTIGLTNGGIISPLKQTHSLEIPNCDELISSKVRLIRSFIPRYSDSLRESDIYDFGMLFKSSDWDIKKVLTILKRYYVRSQRLPEQQAFVVAASEILTLGECIVPDSTINYLHTLIQS